MILGNSLDSFFGGINGSGRKLCRVRYGGDVCVVVSYVHIFKNSIGLDIKGA